MKEHWNPTHKVWPQEKSKVITRATGRKFRYSRHLSMPNALFKFLRATVVVSVAINTSDCLAQLEDTCGYENGMHRNRSLEIIVSSGGSIGSIADAYGHLVMDPFTQGKTFISSYPTGSSIYTGTTGMLLVAQVDNVEQMFNFGCNCPELVGESFLEYGTANPRSNLYKAGVNSSVYIRSQSRLSRFPITDDGCGSLRITSQTEMMSWSADLVDDFIIARVNMKNESKDDYRNAYLILDLSGFRQYYTSEMARLLVRPRGDDISGSLRPNPGVPCDLTSPPHFLAYTLDNDGDPVDDSWRRESPLSATGIMMIEPPDGAFDISYNWMSSLILDSITDRLNWVFDFWEPTYQANKRNRIGYPRSAKEWYELASNEEVDYDQIYAATSQIGTGWRPPSEYADQYSISSSYSLVSVGPFDIPAGQSVRVVYAFVAGDSVHVSPTNFKNNFNSSNPSVYRANINFQPLVDNARWASWVYDNPGIDTDGDGYRGEYEICNANPDIGFTGDTLWYQGDGIPDYRADLPPPAPPTRIYTSEGKLVIRWNGFDVEKTIDPFTQKMDFQGYKIYLGRDPRLESLVLHSQWDKEDYIALKFVLRADGGGDWVPDSEPMSLDSITDYYDLPEHPLSYTRQNSYNFNNENYYFEKQDNNVSDLTNLSGIHKAYPDAIPPVSSDSLLWSESEYTTEHGRKYPKYSEYEYIIDGILPSVPYYVAVTAFDHGFVLGGMPPQESDPVRSLQQTLALPSADSVEANNLDVFCYPNPYRIDDNYVERGYENRDQSIPDQKAGRIHFANLPRKCTISIFSLDGDRIWSYDHNPPQYSANDMHAEWDLISRNRQLVVSGLYYWVVESETRTQIGKLMILK